jgi:uncharacterized protein (TIGR02145 family)
MDMETFIDPRDGNTYRIARIGNQCWLAENLKYLPAVCPSTTTPNGSAMYYVYDYQGRCVDEAKATANYRNYGVLYNWPAAPAACPPGWHLPSDQEWSELVDFLISPQGGLSRGTAAYALKVCDSQEGGGERTCWERAAPGPCKRGFVQTLRRAVRRTLDRTPQARNTDRFGFSALPGGRCTYGGFYYLGDLGYWWSQTEASSLRAWCRQMTCAGAVNRWDMHKQYGYSVRCIQD